MTYERKPTDLITPEGETVLRDELDFLWRIERPKITQDVSDAAKLGDRSENAEYIYGKRRLREIDRRVRFLRKRLEALNVVNAKPADPTKVRFGAWIDVEYENGKQARYRIVGPDEIDHQPGYISIASPVARALLGKGVDDEAIVQTPSGTHEIVILAVNYSKPG